LSPTDDGPTGPDGDPLPPPHPATANPATTATTSAEFRMPKYRASAAPVVVDEVDAF
jgi:hypothetical protein